MCCVYAAVVFFCHLSPFVRNKFLFHAQDHNMTNGDFAFFTFEPHRTYETDRPWMPMTFSYDYDDEFDDEFDYDYDVNYDEIDLPRRRQAFYAMKQVLVFIRRLP